MWRTCLTRSTKGGIARGHARIVSPSMLYPSQEFDLCRVGIYWNLKTGGFSMCLLKSDKTRGAVVAHCESVDLQNVRLVVSEGGRLAQCGQIQGSACLACGRPAGVHRNPY